DLQSLTLKRYARGVAAVTLMSVVVVNLVTIAADLQAGAARRRAAGRPRFPLASGAAGGGSGRAAAGQPVRPGGGGAAAPDAGVRRFRVAMLAHPGWPRLLTASLVPGAAGFWSA